MANSPTPTTPSAPARGPSAAGSAAAPGVTDVRRILGPLDDTSVADILALGPSIADLEDAAICMTGDRDVLPKSGHHVPATASRIIELLADLEEEPGT